MKVKVSLAVGPELVKEVWLDIDDKKLEEMPEDEVEAIIEVYVRDWADRQLSISWEAD